MRGFTTLRNKLLAGIFLLSAGAMSMWGQMSNASISGRVTDPSGAPIVGARIRATAVDTNVSHQTVSAESGNYTIPLLSVGTYVVEAEAKGFKVLKHEGILLQTATNQELNFPLQIGDVSEVLNVEASAPLLDT